MELPAGPRIYLKYLEVPNCWLTPDTATAPFKVVHRASWSLLGPVVPSFRTLSGRLQFAVRRHQFNKDSLPDQGRLIRKTISVSESVCQRESASVLAASDAELLGPEPATKAEARKSVTSDGASSVTTGVFESVYRARPISIY